MPETIKTLPLSGEEIRNALLYKIEQSLLNTCNLRDTDAYTSFSAEISIRLRLDDYGREVKDNHLVTEKVGEPSPTLQEICEKIDVLPAPPNQVRIDTDQAIPVETTENGKRVVKKVKYQPKKSRHANH